MKKTMLTLALVAVLIMIAGAAYALRNSPIRVFDITPNPMDKECSITVGVTTPQNITIQIKAKDDELVREIYSGPVYKDISLTWNRYDYLGNFVPAGDYTVILSFDSRFTSLKKTLILK
ncbi:MAG: hypothetical protein ABFC98_08475 [Candidatus Cloacimonas sp.]